MPVHRTIIRRTALGVVAVVAVAACGGSDDATSTVEEPAAAPVQESSPAAVTESTTAPTVDPPSTEPTKSTTSTPPPETTTTTTAPPESSTSVDPAVMAVFRAEVAENCDAAAALAALPEPNGTLEGVDAQLAVLAPGGVPAAIQSSVVDSFTVPAELDDDLDRVREIAKRSDDALAASLAARAAGDALTADHEIDAVLAHLSSMAGALAVMGASCLFADADKAASADLNVQLDLGAEQIATGFGSMWASQSLGGNVVRFDPETGEIIATVDVGESPVKAQPADGRMWVRTRDAFVGIDAETNTVTATILKADIGPNANRNWAIDGSMWICDGQQLHRYDPTTLEEVAVVELDIACDAIYATPDLVVAWSYDDNPGAVPEPAVAMIDPATNGVLATIPLPVEVLAPAVFDDSVFFAGNYNSTGVVIDRDTWTVSSTVDLGRATHGGLIVDDGNRIFAPTRDDQGTDVLVIDASTFEVVDTIEPISVNGLAVDDGSLWTTNLFGNVAQRFDYDT